MGRKQWENVKLLATKNFLFLQSVFRRLVLQTPKKQGLILETVKIYTDARTTNTASSRLITTFMPLKHRRGMLELFYLKIVFFLPQVYIMFIITG